MRDYYDIFGVTPNASPEEIKERYRFLAHAYHPDKFVSEQHRQRAEQQFKEINEAYETLKDPERRRSYDTTRTRNVPPPPRPSPSPSPSRRKPAFVWLIAAASVVACVTFIGSFRHSSEPPSPTGPTRTPTWEDTEPLLGENMTMFAVEHSFGKPDSTAKEPGSINGNEETPTVIKWFYKRYPMINSGVLYGQPGYIIFIPERFTQFCRDPKQADSLARKYGEGADSFRTVSYQGSFPTNRQHWEGGSLGFIPIKTVHPTTTTP
jgi:hypothetical protein